MRFMKFGCYLTQVMKYYTQKTKKKKRKRKKKETHSWRQIPDVSLTIMER